MKVVLRVASGPHERLETTFEGAGARIVGRAPQVSFALSEDRLLSREHFVIEVNPPVCDLVDLGSTNGTKVNGLRVDRVRLSSGDVIAAGDSTIAISVCEELVGSNPPLRLFELRDRCAAGAAARDRVIALALPQLLVSPRPVSHDQPRLSHR